jgi:hypothetical protein
MTTRPHRPLIVEDVELGVSGNQVQVSNGKRKAANDRQRKAAAEEAEHDRWYAAKVEEIWGRP